MHELGLVKQVVDTVEKLAEEQDLTQIASVTLEIGEVSGIIPEYLSDCWQWMQKKLVLLEHTELKVETLPAVTLCETCGAHYATIEHGKQCPQCQSESTYLLHGNEFIIKEILAC